MSSRPKIVLELNIYRLIEHEEAAKLLCKHREPWFEAFRTFVRRHWLLRLERYPSHTESSTQNATVVHDIQLGKPIQPFIIDGRDGGRFHWYGRDLSEFIRVTPLLADPTSQLTNVSDPRQWEIVDVSIRLSATEGSSEEHQEILNDLPTEWDSVLSYLPSARSSTRQSVQSRRSSTSDSDDVHSQHAESLSFTDPESPSSTSCASGHAFWEASDTTSPPPAQPVTTTQMCMILSCLLQYSAELFGVTSPHCFTILRRYILPVIISMVHHGPVDVVSESEVEIRENDDTASKAGLRSFVEFDRGKLEACLEDWLNLSGSVGKAVDGTGVANGLVCTGGKGVGKTMFCRALIRCLVELAPWAVSVVYLHKRVGTFFDGVYFLDDISTTSENLLLQFHPLSLGQQYLRESSPGGVKRMIKMFQDMRQLAEPGKIVITFIDNLDALTRSLQVHHLFAQLQTEAQNAGFDYFIFATATSPTFPAYDSMDSSKNQFSFNGFKTLKIYPMPLNRSLDFLLKHIRHPPHLAFAKEVIAQIGQIGQSVEFMRKRTGPWKQLEQRMHNLAPADLRKISLHVCLDLAQLLCRSQQPDLNETSTRQQLLYRSIERVLNSVPTLTGLSPNAVITMPWVRHDLNYCAGIEDAAEELYRRSTEQHQYIHFVRVVTSHENESDEDFYLKATQGKYQHLTIPQRSIQSLLHHLHKLFGFRQSYILESPEQILPYHPRLSADVPRVNLNALDTFYWQNRNSLLVLNTLESIVGFYKEKTTARMTNMEKERILLKTVSDNHSLSRGLEFGLVSDICFKDVLETNAENGNNIVSGVSTGGSADGSLGIGFFKLNSPEAKGRVKKYWDAYRTVDNAVGRAVEGYYAIWPGVLFNANIENESNSHQGEALNHFDLGFEQWGDSHSSTFEIPEARSKLVHGLESFCAANNRAVDKLGNLVLIFYRYESCFEQIAVKRLGWNRDGSYSPPRVGCKHYDRYLKVKAPCCGAWVPCEFCHDEQVEDGHHMDRRKVQELQCLVCHHRQSLIDTKEKQTVTRTHGIHCANPQCGSRFSAVCCIKCRIWNDRVPKGGLKHCRRCNQCYPGEYLSLHQQMCAKM